MAFQAQIHDLKVYPSHSRSRAFDVSWRVDPVGTPFVPRYMVKVAETEMGPWYDALPEPTEETSVQGVGSALLSHSPGRFVLLEVLDPDGRSIQRSSAMSPSPEMSRTEYLEYRDHLRRESLALEKRTGTRGFLIRRVVSECPCPECADPILERGAPDSSCRTCMGTGTARGYHPPIQALLDWSAVMKGSGNRVSTQAGFLEADQRTVRLMPFPSMAAEDIVADRATGLRHIVKRVEPVPFKVWPVAQILSVVLLPKSDPVYRIPLPR